LIAFNPVIKNLSNETVFCAEGCLSLPGRVGIVERSRTITIEYTDQNGERITEMLTGYPARAVQHEVDHLDGKLYVDRMVWHSIMREEEYLADWKDKTPDELRLAFAA
jgi:peptide deformylase